LQCRARIFARSRTRRGAQSGLFYNLNAAFCCKGSNKIAVNGAAKLRSYTAYRLAFVCSNALLASGDDRCEVGAQRRDFVLHHIPHEIQVDAKIFVN